jgi:hypothetical protein
MEKSLLTQQVIYLLNRFTIFSCQQKISHWEIDLSFKYITSTEDLKELK